MPNRTEVYKARVKEQLHSLAVTAFSYSPWHGETEKEKERVTNEILRLFEESGSGQSKTEILTNFELRNAKI